MALGLWILKAAPDELVDIVDLGPLEEGQGGLVDHHAGAVAFDHPVILVDLGIEIEGV